MHLPLAMLAATWICCPTTNRGAGLSDWIPTRVSGDCVGGTFSTGATPSRLRTGWKFVDGTTVLFGGGPFDLVSYLVPTYESEVYRLTTVVGVPAGVSQEWYLGHGVAAVVGTTILPIRVRITVHWFLIEGLSFSAGFDFVSGRWECGWDAIL